MPSNSDWRALARRYARKYGFPEDVFERQMGQEAGGRDVSSPAGAQGPAQIMPDTAAAWGVKNVHDINQAYDAAAKHMAGYVKQYGSVKNALIAYNAGPGRIGKPLPAETRNYIKTIMGGSGGGSSAPRSSGGAVASAASTMPGLLGASQATGDSRLAQLAATLQRLDAATPKLAYNSPFSRADDSTDPTQGQDPFSTPPSSDFSTFVPSKVTVPQPQTPSLGDVLASLAQSQGSSPQSAPVTSSGAGTGGYSAGDLVGGKGKFKVSGPNPGRIQGYVSSFMSRVASVYGHPITGSDGTGHSKYTVNGNVSEHFTGSAVDNPASGATLTRMGQAALIAAGMPRTQAMKQKGGLFNVMAKDGTRYQIIFNTMQGGNHFDHLHVGVRPGRK